MSLVLEIVVAVLLACTIIYAFVLNRRLAELRKDKARLEKLAARFHDATEKAEASVLRLKATADDSVRTMQHCISEAQGLRDDLRFLIESGESTADKLESGIRMGKQTVRASNPELTPENAETVERIDDDPESALLRALQSAR